MSWDIKGKDNQIKATVDALEYNGEWMGEVYVSVTIESPTPIDFAIGDYLIYRGERFEINYDPGKIKSAPQYAKGDAFKYENVKFNSLADELTRCDFRDVVLQDNNLHFTSLPKFTFFGGVQDLANRIQANLDKLYTGANKWSVVVSPEFQGGKELNVSVDNIKVQGALEILVNQFGTYYTIKGRTITIGAAGVPAGHLFKYGKGNGLYEIEQNAEADQAIVTRLRAYGSTRNLPHRYYNSLTGADGQKLIPDNMAVQYLMLPSFPYTTQDPYIDSANKAALGIREGTIFFDGSQEGLEEIYPSIEGMTAEQLKAAGVPCNSTGALDVLVSAEQMTDDGVGEISEGETETTATPPTFKVTVKDLGFNINDHLTTETATISFKTGMLGGREFEIVGCKPIKNASDAVTGYELELNRVYDDGIKLWFPYKDYNAKAGDKITILHISMPEVYIKAAAQRLLEAATAWLAKNDYSRSVYAPKVDEIFMALQHDEAMASGGSIVSLHDTLKEGMMLLFEDDDLNIDASIFIDQLIIKEGDGPIPTYEITLKEEKTVGRLDKMQNQIDSLAAGQGQGSGGYNASQIRSLIDAYGGTRFLSRIKDDRTAHKLATDKAFEVGEFLAGISGGFFGIDQNGDSYLEVARLYARVRAVFEELTVIKTGVLAGKQYITPGGGIVCTKVEEVTNASGTLTGWRCYFLSEQDGEKTECNFRANDQAISAVFNAATGTANKVSNHRYWRLVTAVDNDACTDDNGNHYGYIELSATDCEAGSDTPQAGDEICQFGYRGTDEPRRQTAMVFSTVDADAPSIKLFRGINSYTLEGKAVVQFGVDAQTGKVFFRLGATGATQYLEYNQDGGLTLNGKLSIGSTIGDKPLDKYFTDLIPEIPEEYDDSEIKEEIDKYKYLAEALPQNTDVIGGVVLSTLVSLGYKDSDGTRHTLAGMNGSYVSELAGRTIGSWWGGEMEDIFNPDGTKKATLTGKEATSLIRMDGSFYFANGNIGGRTDGSGWLAGDNITWDASGAITFGNGIKIDLGGGKNTTLGGIQDTLGSVLTIVNGLSNVLFPVDSTGARVDWGSPNTWAIKSVKGFFSDSFISARGVNPDGGGSGGGGVYYLHELLDAAINNPATGQALVYNGTKWENQAIQTGLDEAALTSYLTTHNYATQSWVESKGYLTTHQSLANYVTLNTPQNITGAKTFSTNVTFQQPMNTYGFRLRFLENSNFQGGFIGYDGANNIFSIGVHEANDTNLSNDFNAISILRSNAYVGIGTTSPTQKLHVNGNALASQFIKSGGTASQFLMGDGSVVTKKSLSTVDNSGWTTFATDDKLVPTMAFIAYWNGRHNASNSNLQYCDRGRFGTIVTHAHSEYVTALGTSGDYLTWTKNGAANNITVPYATTAAQLTGSAEHTGTTLADFDRTHTYTCQATNDLGDGISYSAILTVSGGSEHRLFQLIGGKGNPSYLRWRTTDANGAALGAVHRLLDDANYSSVLDSRYYTESEINAKLTNGSVTKVGTTTVGSTAKGIYLNGGTPTALSATVGAANRPVYMNAGTITAGTYTFGNGSGNAPISNGTLCTNLNADLLDGLHNGALTARYLNLAAFVTNCNAMPTHNGIFSWSGTNSANPATYGVLLQWSSVDNPTPGTDQHWITQLASATSNRLFYRTRINTGAWSGWSAVAFTSDNVASATKLQTARTLWGQSFNGTANVDGALTVHHTGACGVYISGGGESSYSCQASGGLRWVSGAYPDRYFIWDSSGNGNERLTILNNGSVGIGTTSPSAKLDVIGVIHSTAGMWSNGYVSARGQNTSSDARLKTILRTKLLDTRSIAAAPSVLFRWKSDGREDIGSIAQYWQRIDRHLVSRMPDGHLGLDYGKAALLSVISVAKKTLNHEERIKALEKENARLKEQIKSLT